MRCSVFVPAALVGLLLVGIVPTGALAPAAVTSPDSSAANGVTVPGTTATPLLGPGVLVILPDGTLSDPTAPVSVSGNSYTLTRDFVGAIVDERNGSVLDGGGFTVGTSASETAAVAIYLAREVTVSNLQTRGGQAGLLVRGSVGVDLLAVTIADTPRGVEIANSSSVLLEQVTTSSVDIGLDAAAAQGVTVQGSVLGARHVALNVSGSSNLTVNASDLSGAGEAAAVLSQVSGAFFTATDLSARPGSNASGLVATGSANLRVDHDRANDTGTGFALLNSAHIVVADSVAERAWRGVDLAGDQDVMVRANDLSHASAAAPGSSGLRIDQVLDFTLTDNDLSEAGEVGATISYGVHGTVTGNDVSGAARVGLAMSYSHNVQMSGNTADGISAVGAAGFSFSGNGRLDFVANEVNHDYYGIVDRYSNRLWVVNSVFDQPLASAIFTQHDRELQVRSSELLGSPTALRGLDIEDGVGVVVSGNEMTGWVGTAIYAANATLLTVASNTILSPGNEGIHLDNGSDLAVSANTVDGAGSVGIEVDHLVNFTVTANALRHEPTGLRSVGGVAGTFADNNASFDQIGFDEQGDAQVLWTSNELFQDNRSFLFRPAQDVRVYHNNFLSDGGFEMAADSTATGSGWDGGYPVGGNYWSNWTGPDVLNGTGQDLPGSDGIVDQALVADGAAVDRYPLTTPWNYSAITFVESGLPAGAVWGVLFNGVPFKTSATKLAVPETNGAYSPYSYQALPPPGYRAPTGTGHGMMHRHSLAVTVAFTPSATNYSVTFLATGLPTGTAWQVSFNGQSATSTTGSVAFGATNGSYSFSVGSVPGFRAIPASGTVTVAGAAATLELVFEPISYPLTIRESGLTEGSPWTVTIGGSTYASTSSQIEVNLTNGTYGYLVSGPDSYRPIPREGSVTIAGAPFGMSIAFAPVTFAVSWQTTALPYGLAWTLTVAGTPYTVTGGILLLSLPNGSYPFTVRAPAGFTVVTASGTVVVDGASVAVAVSFAPVNYALTFEAKGLPEGSLWVLTLDGIDHASRSNVLVVNIPNGTFNYSVLAEGFTASPGAGEVKVTGSSLEVLLAFVPTSGGAAAGAGPGSLGLWLGLGAVAVGVALVAILLLLRRDRRPTRTTPAPQASAPSGRDR